MKRFIYAVLLLVAATSLAAFVPKPRKVEIKKKATRIDSVAYAFGVANGEGFRKNLASMPGDSLDYALIMKGFAAAFLAEPTAIKAEEAMSTVQGYFSEAQKKEEAENKAKNEAFLAANKEKPEVKTTKSGLQYRIIREGEGKQPMVQDTVVVNYTGKTIDGNVFDDSYKRGEPATFGLLQVIPGWTEGLCLMKKGAKYEFVIPAELGYGERGAGGMIKPNSTLVFDVELLDIKPYVETEADKAKIITVDANDKTVTLPAKKAKAAGKTAKKVVEASKPVVEESNAIGLMESPEEKAKTEAGKTNRK